MNLLPHRYRLVFPAVGVGFVVIANFTGTLLKGVPKMSVIKTLNVSNVERIIVE